jgi:pimeloyl-ACP methyl ester carboxylesterase
MPFVTGADGVRTFYETQGEGEALLLVHGHSMAGARWHGAGYVEALRDEYRMIVVDVRGHGRSDKPHDVSAYALETICDDMLRVLDDADAASVHAWGYSMGGGIVEQLCASAPERIRSAIVGGWARVQRQPVETDPRYEALQQGIEAYVTLIATQLAESVRAVFLENDAQALAAALAAAPGWPLEAVSFSCPVLVYAGAEDAAHGPAQEFASRVGARFHSIAGANHGMAFGVSAAIVPAVREFLTQVGLPQEA